jgi:hypothetical protein
VRQLSAAAAWNNIIMCVRVESTMTALDCPGKLRDCFALVGLDGKCLGASMQQVLEAAALACASCAR